MAKIKEPKVNLVEVLKEVMDAKNMDDSVIEGALKQALISAARKYLHIDKKIEVDIDKETNEIHVFLRVEVVDDYPDYDPNMTAEEVEEMDEGYMLVAEAQEYNEDAQPGDFLEMEVPTTSFGRQAIQTAKQLLTQQIRDAERQKITDTYRGRIGTMISGEVLRLEGRNVIVSLGKQTEAMIPPREQIGHERLVQGQSVKAVIARVEDSAKNGAQVVLSRASGDFLKELFRQEVPEIYDGSVEIKGARVQTIVRELGNERIDIVHWNPNMDVFITRALAPANVVKLSEVPGTRRVVVVINDDNLAQAIGKNGQNVKLASQLVERDLDVFGEKEWSEKDDEAKALVLAPRPQELRRAAARKADALFGDAAKQENAAAEPQEEAVAEVQTEAQENE